MAYFGAVQVSVMIGLAIMLALFLDSPYCRGGSSSPLCTSFPSPYPGLSRPSSGASCCEPDLDSALNVPHRLGLAHGPLTPLDYRLSLYAIMLIVTWEFTGYNMTILLTSLTNVPHQVLEAAKVDGCSELAIATRIKLPLIRRTVMFIVILSIIGTLQLFNEPVILNEIASIGNSFTPNQIIYNTAFSFGNEQLAAAQSVILAAITIVATVAFFGLVRRKLDPSARPGVGERDGSRRCSFAQPRHPGRGRGSGGLLARRMKTTVGTAALLVVAVYVVAPIYWLVVASAKNTSQLFSTSTFLPPAHLNWISNVKSLFSYNTGDFKWWFLNSVIYATATAALATAVSTLCGYGLAKYRFRMRRTVFGLVVGSLDSAGDGPGRAPVPFGARRRA